MMIVGCGKPIAHALPLVPVTHWTIPEQPRPIVDITPDGLTVVGSSGDALTTATRIHQMLRALKISNEVRCKITSETTARTRLHISFPDGPLTADQQQQVNKLLQGIDRG